MNADTIVAIATPPGQGGVGIIRVSGPSSLSIAQTMSRQEKLAPRQAHYCHFYDKDETVIDMGLVLYFKGPNSFTGEDIVEFQAHGSPIALSRLISRCIECGARMANPGEFSQRAFLNDKIDLTQAEAIADLIASQSNSAAKLAVNSLQGVFSIEINKLVDSLIHLRCYVEAAIDFPEEEIDFLSDGKVQADLNIIIAELERVISNACQGVILREGINVVLAGKPNAGKSTLLNRLAGRDLAIVTDVPGTTRDVMRQHLLIDDIPLHVIDTAGLRQSEDLVESEGIKRAWREIKQADCVLLLIDKSIDDEAESLHREIKDELPQNVPVLTIFNKMDLLASAKTSDDDSLCISAKTGLGIDELKRRLKNTVGYQPTEGRFIARSRHLNALREALNALEVGMEQLLTHKAGELLAEDLRLAQSALSEITGEFTSDDLLGKIFSSFCIGK